MSKRREKLDNSGQLELDFSAAVDRYVEAKEELTQAVRQPIPAPEPTGQECEFEACVEIAAACKRAQREASMSREQLADGINAFFGRSEEGAKAEQPTCRKPVSLAMLNHYLSKPADYPMPAYMLMAVCHVTGSLEPLQAIASTLGGRIAAGDEIRQLQIGRLEETLTELQQLKRELKRK
jgi:hypothetical protein